MTIISPQQPKTVENADSATAAEMKRLPFSMPDFTRVSWVSDAARGAWENRLQRIVGAWAEIEWLSIVDGVRECCMTIVNPDQFVERAAIWANHGLASIPLALTGGDSNCYSINSAAPQHGKPFRFRVVVGAPGRVGEFIRCWHTLDNEGIGTLLGYPSCCRRFFDRVWTDEQLLDTTWPAARATSGASSNGTVIEFQAPRLANILWRWLGIRAVAHLPCRFDCAATIALAERFVEVGRSHGFQTEVDWMMEMLDWPVEWSALHGIAEIKTPILKVSTRTDATACKYTVRYRGNSHPPEAAHGLRFPYVAPRLHALSGSESFARGIKNPIAVSAPSDQPWYAADNGFSSNAAMDAAHDEVLKLAAPYLAGTAGMVLDLGCGNCALLKKLCETNPAIAPAGVDIDADRISHARELLPNFANSLTCGNLFETESIWPESRRYLLALVMPGRLLEATPEQASVLRERLRTRCDRILIYAYGDWLGRYGSLKGLANAACFELCDSEEGAGAAFAEVR